MRVKKFLFGNGDFIKFMKRKILILIMAVLSCEGIITGCGKTDFSSDVVVVESDEPIEVAGNKYLSKIENYYYTFHEDGTMYLESLNEKYQFEGTYEVKDGQITLSSKNTDGEDSVITYTMKHGEPDGSIVMVTEDGEKFLLTLEE